jgi:hypothetical protein
MITTDSPLQAAKERLLIPALWLLLSLPGKPGHSCGSPFREDRNPRIVTKSLLPRSRGGEAIWSKKAIA